jgi:hypothetical protein
MGCPGLNAAGLFRPAGRGGSTTRQGVGKRCPVAPSKPGCRKLVPTFARPCYTREPSGDQILLRHSASDTAASRRALADTKAHFNRGMNHAYVKTGL